MDVTPQPTTVFFDANSSTTGAVDDEIFETSNKDLIALSPNSVLSNDSEKVDLKIQEKEQKFLYATDAEEGNNESSKKTKANAVPELSSGRSIADFSYKMFKITIRQTSELLDLFYEVK